MTEVPTFDRFMNPILKALKALGGSGTIEEINNFVFELMKLSGEQLELLHDPEKGSQTEAEYRLAWARTYLKKYELLENSSRGVWSLIAKGRQLEQVEPREVRRFVQARDKSQSDQNEIALAQHDPEAQWRVLVAKFLAEMQPHAFERLIQRVLRESGFVQVEVTGRKGDGGIDGKGMMRLGGLMSFHVIFQCKRYQGSVGAEQIRNFRGSMVGRTDKGLFVTTGSFTKDAIKEASRDGAHAIDLINGDELIDKLRELGLGIQVKKVELEQVVVDGTWFQTV